MPLDYSPVDGQATVSSSTRLRGVCSTCKNPKAFCSCNSQLNYNPIERWRNQSKSPSNLSFKAKLAALENFCMFVDKTIYELLAIAQQHQHPGDVQAELEEYLTQYLDSRAARNIAKSTLGRDASRIISFFSVCSVGLLLPRRLRGAEPQYESQRVLTQLEIHEMINSCKTLLEELIVSLITQIGQRIGILSALRYEMIRDLRDGWGLVEMQGDYRNFKGDPVGRKFSTHYRFLIHPESMSLIKKMHEEQNGKSEFIFPMDVRRIQDVFYEIAKRSGVQSTHKTPYLTPSGKHRVKNEVHAHIQRRFFEKQMLKGHATEGLPERIADYFVDFLMGHRGPANYTYLLGILQEEELLAAYMRAEDKLRVIHIKLDR